MNNWVHLISELLYGAVLLTTITVAPDITIKFRVNPNVVFSAQFSYPLLWNTAILSLLLTALAMVPTLGMMPSRLAKRRRYYYLSMTPWVLMCCIKFLLHASMHVFVIRQVTKYNDPTAMTIALAIYCIIFGMATEMMLHWIAVANLLIDTSVDVLVINT